MMETSDMELCSKSSLTKRSWPPISAASADGSSGVSSRSLRLRQTSTPGYRRRRASAVLS